MTNQRICVICHLYYQYMWEEIKEYLSNLEQHTAFDLYITCTETNEELFKKIMSDFNENVKVEINIINNGQGADISPFIYILNKINLEDYDLVYKIHTKQNIAGIFTKLPKFTNCKIYIGENLWRDFMFTSILGKNNVKKVLDTFKKHKDVGCMGFNPLLITFPIKIMDKPKNYSELHSQFGFKELDKYKIYVGTIFAIRTELLKCIQNKYNLKDFTTPSKEKFSHLTYLFEGFLGYLVESQGFKFKSVYSNLHKFCLELLSHRDLFPLFKFYVNKCILKRKVLL